MNSSVPLLLVAALLFSPGCSKDEPPPEPIRPVKLLTLEKPGIYRELSYPATIKAFQEADLSFLVSGRLQDIPVRRGESVELAQILARLDPKDYVNEYDAANSYALERKAYMTRVKDAFDQKAATQSELDEAARQYDVAKARAAIKQKALDDTILRVPFAGEVGRQYKENFQDVLAKEAIFHLQDVSKLKVVIDVPEGVRLLIRESAAEDQGESKITVIFEDLPGQVFEVEYYEDEKTADPFTRTYAVTFTMPAPKPGLILPGMSATLKGQIRFKAVGGDPAFYAPVEAVFSEAGTKRFVWVQDSKTQAVHKREVTVGAMAGDQIEVLKGLQIGETIATSGVHHLVEGMKVRPLQYEAQREQG